MDDRATRQQAEALEPGVRIGIVGAGAMGSGIAQIAAIAGHRVVLFDTRPGAGEKAIDGIGAALYGLLSKGRITSDSVIQAVERLTSVEALADLAECGLVVEAIVENVEAKRELFRQLEEIVSAETILATNTSAISITALGAALQNPRRLAGMHFFNPAPVMPLVEIISGAATDPAVAGTLYATARRWGKEPVHARSTPGFIVNRVARPFYAESLRLLNEGASDCPTLDAVLREAGGFRMGPFELMDLIGHDVNYAVTKTVFEGFYNDPRFTPSLRQLELVEAGFLGRKSGRGFYEYGNNAAPCEAPCSEKVPVPKCIRVFGGGSLAAVIAERLSQSRIPFEAVESSTDGRVAEVDGAVLFLTDGRTATARASATGVRNLVLVDLALDPRKATRLAIAVTDGAEPTTRVSAEGLLQAAGFAVSVLDDAPGLVVMRTVVMLANEAADAVHQGVCNAADCDLAMRRGVNYPRGPLDWADSIGLPQVVAVLDNLANTYGEDRYRVSPLLRRKALAGAAFHAPAEEAHE